MSGCNAEAGADVGPAADTGAGPTADTGVEPAAGADTEPAADADIAPAAMIASDDSHWTLEQCVANTRTLKARHPALRGGHLWESGRPGTADWVSQVGAILKA